MSPRLVAPALLALMALPGAAPAAARSGPFEAGSVRLSLGGGTVGHFGETYFMVAGGVAYYVVDGLEVGLEGEYWIGEDPTVSSVGPQVRYLLHFVPILKPYVGTFYRHWFVGDPYDDIDAVGVRGGAFIVTSGGSFFGGGVVREKIISTCDDNCSKTYPEIVFSVAF